MFIEYHENGAMLFEVLDHSRQRFSPLEWIFRHFELIRKYVQQVNYWYLGTIVAISFVKWYKGALPTPSLKFLYFST